MCVCMLAVTCHGQTLSRTMRESNPSHNQLCDTFLQKDIQKKIIKTVFTQVSFVLFVGWQFDVTHTYDERTHPNNNQLSDIINGALGDCKTLNPTLTLHPTPYKPY